MDRKGFRNHFAIYFVLLLLASAARLLIGQAPPTMGYILAALAWSIPLAGIAAFIAARQRPHVEGAPVPKPRIMKSVVVGLAICTATVVIALLLRE